MRTGQDERPIPITNNRALTELVQSRRQLDAARKSLGLAVELFRTLKTDAAGVPLTALEQVLGQLEDAEATLSESAH
jgi:hypothetical protein